MGCQASTALTLPDMYISPTGALIVFDPSISKKVSGAQELSCVVTRDSVQVQGGAEFYLLHIDWLAIWLKFATGKKKTFVFRIDNSNLIDEVDEYKVKSTIKFKKHYRIFDKIAWEYLFLRYGGGPIIYFHVPAGLSPMSYESRDWIKASKINENARVIYPQNYVEDCQPLKGENHKDNVVTHEDLEVAVGLFYNNLSAAKMKAAQALTAEIAAAKAKNDLAISSKIEWQSKKSEKVLHDLIARKKALLEEACAIKLQSYWRSQKAKQKLVALRKDKKRRHYENAALKIHNLVNRIISVRNLQRERMRLGHVINIWFKSAADINVVGIKYSELTVLISVLNGGVKGVTSSLYKTKAVPNPINSAWSEKALLAGLRGFEDIFLITVIDRESGPIGQVAIPVLKYRQRLCSYSKVALSLPLASQIIPIKLDDGALYPLQNTVQAKGIQLNSVHCRGVINFSMQISPFAYGMCGWMCRLSQEILHSVWKRRYFILMGHKLMYFVTPNELNTIRGHIDCSTITSITAEVSKGGTFYKINYGQSGKEHWSIKFTDDSSIEEISMWMRKIGRCCTIIPSNGVNDFKVHGNYSFSMLSPIAIAATAYGASEGREDSISTRKSSNVGIRRLSRSVFA